MLKYIIRLSGCKLTEIPNVGGTMSADGSTSSLVLMADAGAAQEVALVSPSDLAAVEEENTALREALEVMVNAFPGGNAPASDLGRCVVCGGLTAHTSIRYCAGCARKTARAALSLAPNLGAQLWHQMKKGEELLRRWRDYQAMPYDPEDISRKSEEHAALKAATDAYFNDNGDKEGEPRG